MTGLRCLPLCRALAAALIALSLLAVVPGIAQADGQAALWTALRSGEAFAMMRHALAPGSGDPEHFTPGDCSTQRNLDARGRAQARETGARFRAQGIERAEIHSSPWCRCMDTATGLELGPVRELAPLGSIHGRPQRRAPQMAALAEWLAQREPSGMPLILVTHHSVIRALTGYGPSSGEVVVVRRSADGTLSVLGAL